MPSGSVFEDKVALYLKGLSPEAREMILRRSGRPDDPAAAAAPAVRAGDPGSVALAATPRAPAPLQVNVPLDPLLPTRTVMFEARTALFEPFLPFAVADALLHRQRGWLHPGTFDGLWTFLVREGLPGECAQWDTPREVTLEEAKRLRRDAMPALRASAFAALSRSDAAARRDPHIQQKFTSRIGGEGALADLRDMLDMLPRLPGIEKLLARLPAPIAATEPAEKAAGGPVATHLAAAPDDAIYVATALVGRLASPVTLVRIACQFVSSSDVAVLRRSAPASSLIDVALSAAERHAVRFTASLSQRGPLTRLLHDLRQFHDIVRGASLALDIEDDRMWQSRLSGLRAAISEPLVSAVEGVIPALRRAMMGDRHRRPTDADRDDALRAAALLAAARRHRDSLAVNTAVNRLWPVMDQALQTYGRPCIDRLRKAEGQERDDLILATAVFVEIAEHINGEEYAGLVRKAREKALRGG